MGVAEAKGFHKGKKIVTNHCPPGKVTTTKSCCGRTGNTSASKLPGSSPSTWMEVVVPPFSVLLSYPKLHPGLEVGLSLEVDVDVALRVMI